MPDRHIFLIGMQGCGKSSLGKRVARETGIPFADTDALVAQSANCTVNEFFERFGKPASPSRRRMRSWPAAPAGR